MLITEKQELFNKKEGGGASLITYLVTSYPWQMEIFTSRVQFRSCEQREKCNMISEEPHCLLINACTFSRGTKQKNKQQWVSQAGQPCALRKGQTIPLIFNSERPPWSKVFSFLWPIYWTAQMTQLILPHDLGDQVTKVTLPWEMFDPKSSAALWSPVKPQPSHLLTRRWLNVSYTWPRSGPPWNGSPRAVPWRRKGDQLSEQPGTLPAE